MKSTRSTVLKGEARNCETATARSVLRVIIRQRYVDSIHFNCRLRHLMITGSSCAAENYYNISNEGCKTCISLCPLDRPCMAGIPHHAHYGAVCKYCTLRYCLSIVPTMCPQYATEKLPTCTDHTGKNSVCAFLKAANNNTRRGTQPTQPNFSLQ